MVRIIVPEFPVTESGGFSRHCERQFRSKNEIIRVVAPSRDSVVEFRNILIVLAERVRGHWQSF